MRDYVIVAVVTLIFSAIVIGWINYPNKTFEPWDYMSAAVTVYVFWLGLKWCGGKLGGD